MDIISNVFYSCGTNGRGGAIYLLLSSGNITFNKNCGKNCSNIGTEKVYQFGILSTLIMSNILMNLCVITQCPVYSTELYYSFVLSYGTNTIQSSNFSQNKNQQFTFTSRGNCKSLYNQFEDNSQFWYITIYINRNFLNITLSNFIRNTQSSPSHGLIHSQSFGTFTFIFQCIFIGNSINYLFGCNVNGGMLVQNCFVDQYNTYNLFSYQPSFISVFKTLLTLYPYIYQSCLYLSPKFTYSLKRITFFEFFFILIVK